MFELPSDESGIPFYHDDELLEMWLKAFYYEQLFQEAIIEFGEVPSLHG